MTVHRDEAFVTQLDREGWPLYSTAVLLILLRLYGRARRLGGVRQYEADDYLQIFAGFLFTLLVALLHVITDSGGSNLYEPGEEENFTPEDIEARIQGSKLVLVSEQAMLNLIYVLKASVLILYSRLTLGLSARRFVRYMSIYVAIGWIATQIAMFASCRPFNDYWSVPPSDLQCATYETYAIVQCVFNISSDVAMLAIPLPLIFRMSTVWRQKLVLMVLFSLGLFVIAAALLTKIFNLSDPRSPHYMMWYIREASVAVYVSNLPRVWPMLRQWFPALRSWTTKGMLPTPRHRPLWLGRKGEKLQNTAPTTVREANRDESRARPAATVRRDTFAEFGAWLRASDLELQRPLPIHVTMFPTSSSRVRILDEEKDTEGSPAGQRKRRSTVSNAVSESEVGDVSPQRHTFDLDERRFAWYGSKYGYQYHGDMSP